MLPTPLRDISERRKSNTVTIRWDAGCCAGYATLRGRPMREPSARSAVIWSTCAVAACWLALNAETGRATGPSAVAIVSHLAASAQRMPVPDLDSQKASLKEIRELFKADYAKSKRPGEHRGLIEKLQAQAAGASIAPIDRFVLLTEIESIAVG